MKTIQALAFIFCISNLILAQHIIPFASTNNRIELSVANTSMIAAEKVTVEVTSAPRWLQLQNRKLTIENLTASENKTAQFTFSVEKSAPVNKPEKVLFTVSNSNGETWIKALSLQVSPPENIELFQNYPNPFNPTTTMSYQLPHISNVSLKVFDILGKKIATLEDGMKEAGYHKNEWTALDVASGIYIYQLTLTNSEGVKEFYRKKMLILK